VTNTQLNTSVVTYVLDKSSSKFTVRAFASGMLSALGHSPTFAIRNFSGEVGIDPAAPERASLRIQVVATSLEVMDDIKSSDRKEMEATLNQNVLESDRYPIIGFEAAATSATPLGGGRFGVNMDGNLMLRGVSGTVPVSAQVILMGDMLRASGQFSLLQSSFGIPPVSVAGGALKLKDELKFTFDIVARKQE